MDVTKKVSNLMDNLQRVVDDANELSMFHIHPKKADRLNAFANRAAALREEIAADYDVW